MQPNFYLHVNYFYMTDTFKVKSKTDE